MAERKVTKKVLEDGNGVVFEFADGNTLTVTLSELQPEIVNNLAVHGLSQKIGDSYAGENAENCETIATKVWEQLLAGNWTMRTGEGAGPRISQLAEALARATGQTVQDCVARIADMDDDTKKALRAHDTIQAHLAAIKLEAAQQAAEKAAAKAADSSFDFDALGE